VYPLIFLKNNKYIHINDGNDSKEEIIKKLFQPTLSAKNPDEDETIVRPTAIIEVRIA
jgi:hypothetical protein